MSQELNSIQPKLALAELSVQLMLSQPGQDGADMLCMLFFILGINQDVVDENYYKLVQLRHKDRIHEVHEKCGSICEAERHD
jgi:hypothetical protein